MKLVDSKLSDSYSNFNMACTLWASEMKKMAEVINTNLKGHFSHEKKEGKILKKVRKIGIYYRCFWTDMTKISFFTRRKTL